MKALVLCITCFFCVALNPVGAQTKIKDGTVSSPALPDADALLELESMNKGLLMPRVELESTLLPNPLSAHTAGMTVYNTKDTNDVKPGIYYNDGTRWNALLTSKSPGTGTDPEVNLNVGESYIYYKKDVALSSGNPLLTNHFTDVPVLEGLRLEASYYNTTYYIPRWYNTTGSSMTYTYTCISTVTTNYDEVNSTLAPGAFENVDGDNIVYCTATHAETVTADLLINDKWYRILWYVFIDRSTNPANTAYTVRIWVTRLH